MEWGSALYQTYVTYADKITQTMGRNLFIYFLPEILIGDSVLR